MSTTPQERPILFSDEMVRAILEGRKTVTRRPVKPQPREDLPGVHFPWASFYSNGHVHTWNGDGEGGQNWHQKDHPDEEPSSVALRRTEYPNPCPFGVPGDRLWVREAWRPVERESDMLDGIEFRADGAFVPIANTGKAADEWLAVAKPERENWRPSIHMPRWASRITLEVTDVRVERSQEITCAAVLAEGFETGHDPEFLTTWNDTYASKGLGWDDNPWVWVVQFEVLR